MTNKKYNLDDMDGAQDALEELSWQFKVEESELEKLRAQNEKLEREKEILRRELARKRQAGSSWENYEDDLDVSPSSISEKDLSAWYSGESEDREISHANDFGREAGIIFDEEKLKKDKKVEWSKAPRLRETFWQRFNRHCSEFFRNIVWKFQAGFRAFLIPLRFIWKNFFRVIRFSYLGIRAVLFFPWQLVRAIWLSVVYIYNYLFGGLFDFKKSNEKKIYRRRKKPEAVRVRWMPVKSAKGRDFAFAFAFLILLVVLPFGYNLWNSLSETRGRVLGASEVGVGLLKAAGEAGKSMDFALARRYFAEAGREFESAEQEFARLGVIAETASSVSSDVSAGSQLLRVAKLSSEVGIHLANVAEGWNSLIESTKSTLASVGEGDSYQSDVDWQSLRREFELAETKAYEAVEIISNIDMSSESMDGYRDEVLLIQSNIPSINKMLDTTKRSFDVLSHFLGMEKPARIMLVFQNNAEIRPTGGFMGSYSIMDINKGKIESISTPGGGFYDLKGSLSVSVDTPYPFHVFSPIWQPWNANWFPDWEASAEKISWFYEKSGGSSVDAVISFTPDVLETILGFVGEIDMPEYETSVNSANFVEMAQEEVELDYDKEENKPKKFIADLLPKVLDRVSQIRQDQYMDLWNSLVKLGEERHILFYSRDSDIEKSLQSLGWSGNILMDGEDYLSVIHTNVAGGKTDRVMDTRLTKKTRITGEGFVVSEVEITKTNNGEEGDYFTGHTNTDYIRFYVPYGSKLVGASGFDGPPEDRLFQVSDEADTDPHLAKYEEFVRHDTKTNTRITNEFGKTVFANWMSVGVGETKVAKISYVLPEEISSISDKASPEDIFDSGSNLWQTIRHYFTPQVPVVDNSIEENNLAVYDFYFQKQSGVRSVGFSSSLELEDTWSIKKVLMDEGCSSRTNKTVTYSDGVYNLLPGDPVVRDCHYKVYLSK